jgi:hypothetical protein
MTLEVARGHAACIQRQDLVVKAREAGSAFRYDFRLDAGVAIAGHGDLNFADVAFEFFLAFSVPAVAAARVDTGKLQGVLDKYGIANSYEVYPGTYTSRVADRFQNHVMKLFSQNLS